MDWITKCYEVNGYEVEARYTKENVNEIFRPLIEQIENIASKHTSRVFVFLAAPPACGKSTLVKYLCDLSEQMGYHNMQWIGMDGFHYDNTYLETHFVNGICLRDIKGCPESFNLDKLQKYICITKQQDYKWPIYDRNLHNPKEDAIMIHKKIILLEGNYLLLKEAGWSQLAALCDFSIFISAREEYLAKRLIERKAKGTNAFEEAVHFYEQSDKKNIQRVLANRMDADVTLDLDTEGIFHKIKES